MAGAKRQQDNTSHSIETGEGSRPSGRGEVGSDATSPLERKRKAQANTSISANARTRSIYYENANREFCKIVDYGKRRFDFSFIEDQCRRWIVVYISGRYVVLKHKTEDKWLLIRQFNRFQPAYKERLNESLGWLRFVDFQTMITLTVDPKRFGLLHHEYYFVKKGWAKLHRWLRKKYGVFFYVCILEITKKGRPHLHILTTLPFIDVNDLREKWTKYGGGQQMRVDFLHRNFDSVAYVLKYVTKSLVNTAEGDVDLSTVLLFASNKRLFSMNDLRNRSMLDIHHRASETFYEIKGSVPLGVVESLCREIKIDMEDFITVKPNDDVSALYPDVFGYSYDGG